MSDETDRYDHEHGTAVEAGHDIEQEHCAEVDRLRAQLAEKEAESTKLRDWANLAVAEEQREKHKAKDLAQRWLKECLKAQRERDAARAEVGRLRGCLDGIASMYPPSDNMSARAGLHACIDSAWAALNPDVQYRAATPPKTVRP